MQQDWGKWVIPKKEDIENFYPELLKLKPKLNGKKILMSSVTDPYQPAEAKYKLTRKILQIWLKVKPQAYLEALTRSTLILRDIELLKQLENFTVGVSISIIPQKDFRLYEPYSPPIFARIKTLEKLQKTGINVYAFIAPVWPGQIKQLMRAINKLTKLNIEIRFIELLNKIARRQFNVDFKKSEVSEIKKLGEKGKALVIEH